MTTVPTVQVPAGQDHQHQWREVRDHSGIPRVQCTGCGRTRRTALPPTGQPWGSR